MVSDPFTVIFFGAGMNAKPMIAIIKTLARTINLFVLLIREGLFNITRGSNYFIKKLIM